MEVLDPSLSQKDIESHYALVAPILERIFGAIPIVWAGWPAGATAPQWHSEFYGHYTKLSAQHILHLAAIGAGEFHSWTPIVEDASRCRFARLLIEEPRAPVGPRMIKEAATVLRALLVEQDRDAIPVLDGFGNIALYVPVSDGPSYETVRLWAHALANRAIAAHPQLVSAAPNTHADGRVHLHVSSNAVGRWSVLPYSVRHNSGRVATPIHWDELPDADIEGISAAVFPERLREAGELFGEELKRIPALPIPGEEPHKSAVQIMPAAFNPTGAVMQAVVQILSDGKPRTADELWEQAHAQQLISDSTTRNALYIDLTQTIARIEGRGRKPPIVQDHDRRFRINEPPDLWPDVPTAPAAPVSPERQALIDRLRATAVGKDPTAFEVAVCDAFAALGFFATHLGGVGNPDGCIDAELGTLGYRVMLECKTGPDMVQSPKVFEAAKFRETYQAQYCALVGPDFGNGFDVASELEAHSVSAWTTEDLATCLSIAANPLEMEPLFAAGFVADRLNDILWARNHGEAKRVRMVADIIHRVGWLTQTAAAEPNTPADAPLLTEDAAMLLVDQELAAQGARVNCTREEVRLAFEWLTNPLVSTATWNEQRSAIVILRVP